MKQATRILSVLLALLMAFSVTAIAAGGLTVTAKYGDADLEGATVPAGSDITLEFSNNVTDESVLASNLSKIKLLDASGENAAASLSVGSQKSTIVVTLGSTLAKGSYTLTLGKDIQAKNGATLGEKKEFKFNVKGSGTGTGGGDKKLTVVSVTVDGEPLEGKELESGAQIVIAFSNGMVTYFADNSELISVTKEDGTKASYELKKNDDDANDNAKREYILTLGENDGGALTLVIDADVKANNGNSLGEQYAVSFSFKAAEQPTEPEEPAQPTFLDRVKAFFTDLLAKLKQFDLNVQLFLIKILMFLGLVPMLGGFDPAAV